MALDGKPQRRSLKDCVKTLLHRRQGGRDGTVPALASVHNEPSLALLPSLLSLSTLSDFSGSRFDINRYSASLYRHSDFTDSRLTITNDSRPVVRQNPRFVPCSTNRDVQDAYQFQCDLSQLATAYSLGINDNTTGNGLSTGFRILEDRRSSSTTSVLSKSSLSQVISPDSIHLQSPLDQIAYNCNVPSVYKYGHSLQASLVTMHSSLRSASTLRLQRSTQSMRLNRAISPVSVPVCSSYTLSSRIEELDTKSPQGIPRIAEPVCQAPFPHQELKVEDQCQAELVSDANGEDYNINHFKSFCVLDAASPGHPITALSDDLVSVFELGEPFFLNTAAIDGPGMDIVTGQDTMGEVVIHFVVYSPLINPNTGRSRFIVASLLDITSLIMGVSTIPDLETTSVESTSEDEIRTPPKVRIQHSPEFNFHGEESIKEHNGFDLFRTPDRPLKEDIWLDIATEESRRTRSISSSGNGSSAAGSIASSRTSVDDILDGFLTDLQSLYSNFVLLGRSPLDDASHDICNVSPSVYETRDFVDGYLAWITQEDKLYLEEKLKGCKSFNMRVNWGINGLLKHLYAIPLFGRSNVTWICFLVDNGKQAGLPTWR